MNDKVKKENTDQKPLKLKKNDEKSPKNLTTPYDLSRDPYALRRESPPPSNNFYPDENHMRALHEVCVVKGPFYCVYCKKMCESEDHYQLNEWWIIKNIF